MTKQQILDTRIDFAYDDAGIYPDEQIFIAMEMYAKQQVFAFLKFREEFKRRERDEMIKLHAKLGGTTTWVGTSDEKIYEEFEKLNVEPPNNNP